MFNIQEFKNDKKLRCLIAGSALVGVGLAPMASHSKTSTEVLEVGYKWMGSFDRYSFINNLCRLDVIVMEIY